MGLDKMAQASLEESEELALEIQKREAELKQLQVTEVGRKRVEHRLTVATTSKTRGRIHPTARRPNEIHRFFGST